RFSPRLPEAAPLTRCHRPVIKLLPGAEAAPGAGQHQHARLVELAERVGDLLVHLDGEAVEPVRAVENEAGDAGLQLELDGFVSHGAALAPPPNLREGARRGAGVSPDD